jgi:hypothetical protein
MMVTLSSSLLSLSDDEDVITRDLLTADALTDVVEFR